MKINICSIMELCIVLMLGAMYVIFIYALATGG
jgi:hypothetical protein